MGHTILKSCAALLAVATLHAQAFQILSVSPQGQAVRVRQVVANLVNNSFNYTPAEGEVTVRVYPENGSVRVDVRDNGIGIHPDVQERIFERFYRGDDPLILATAGTGLGLAIARNLIEMHSGKIWFESSGLEGEGSTFSFTLPVYKNKE